eukprot:scaffold2180_cov98-Skeletonema_marinoi.AAC.15
MPCVDFDTLLGKGGEIRGLDSHAGILQQQHNSAINRIAHRLSHQDDGLERSRVGKHPNNLKLWATKMKYMLTTIGLHSHSNTGRNSRHFSI